MAAPQIKINGGSAGVKASCSASSAVTATLDDITGVRTVTWSIASTDETTAAASYTLTQSGSVGQNVAFTSLGAGSAGILKAVINGGYNLQTDLADSANTTATCKFYVPLASGTYTEVGAAGEKMESDSTFGSTGIINAGVRSAATAAAYEFLLNRATVPAGAPSSIATLAMSSTLTFRQSNVTGAVRTVEKLSLSISDNSGHGAAGDGVALGFETPDAGGSQKTLGRLRYEYTDPTALSPRAKSVLSVLSTDGEHDYFTIADTGNITLNTPSGVARTMLCEGQALSFAVGGDVRSGTGANNGLDVTFKGGDGQAQTGGAANNDGGDAILKSGAAGTGGGGSAGVDGDAYIKTGSTTRIVAKGSGADITLTTVAVKAITTSGVQCDEGFDTIANTGLLLGTNHATELYFNSSGGGIQWRAAGNNARTDTYDAVGATTHAYVAGVSSIAESWAQDAASSGGTWTRTGQQGLAGNVGGSLAFVVGDGGTPGTNAPGNILLGLGTPVAQVTGKLRLQTAAAAVVCDITTQGGPALLIQNGSYTTAGLEVKASSGGYAGLYGTSYAFVRGAGGAVRLQTSTATVEFYKDATLGSSFVFDPTAAQSLTSTIRSGTGANNGVSLTIQAQQGQAQSGGAANNNGGALVLRSGAAGTGGGGAAGTAGSLTLGVGSFDAFYATPTALSIDAEGSITIGAGSCTSMSLLSSAVPLAIYGDTTFHGTVAATLPITLASYTVAGVPSASPAGQYIYVSNESGGAVPAFSDGTNWRRVTDRAIVS